MMGRCVLASSSFTSATCNLSRARRIFRGSGLVTVIVLVPGSSKKQPTNLKSWRGELDTPGPPISMLCDSSLQKNSHSCSGHWEAMVGNIETGGPGASGECRNFLVDGCFFWRTRCLQLQFTFHLPALIVRQGSSENGFRKATDGGQKNYRNSDRIGFLFVYMCPWKAFVIRVLLVLCSLVQVCKLMHQMCPRHHQRSWLSTGWAGTGNFQNKIWLQRTCENGLWAPWLSRW